MGLRDLFKTPKQRLIERKTLERQTHRKAESALDACNERVQTLKAEGKKIWNETIDYLKSGDKLSAKRNMLMYRWHQKIIEQLERKKFIFQKYIIILENAKTDNVFSEAMDTIVKLIDVNPEIIIDKLETADEKFSELSEIDKYYEKAFGKEMAKSEEGMLDSIPSIDEMMKQAEQEAAVQIDPSPSVLNTPDSELTSKISAGLSKIKKMLEESEKKCVFTVIKKRKKKPPPSVLWKKKIIKRLLFMFSRRPNIHIILPNSPTARLLKPI
ncbi:MAG: hypothetical protein Q4C95_12455 [Planctomycetia bacterium]|nr:hypothetical protein [Planctomycetia bacterium]